jgi:hypothetical protein
MEEAQRAFWMERYITYQEEREDLHDQLST